MALINRASSAIVRSEVDLFNLPPTDTTIESSFYAEYKPIVNIQESNSRIDFRIIGNGTQYLDINDSFLYIKLKVVCSDGTDLPDDASVSCVNNFMHSLFSNCDFSINDTIVLSSNNCYTYKAYLETLLSHGKEYLESQGSAFMFYPDTNGNALNNQNTGYKNRKHFIAKSQPLELVDRLRLDVASQHRYILNDTNVTLSLARSSDQFSLTYLHSGTASDPYLNPKVKLLDASLFVRKHTLYPSLSIAHQKLLESGHNAIYPIKKCDTKFFTIPQGNQSFVEENVFMGSLPSKIVIGLVKNSSFTGTYTTDPFYFDHFALNYLSITVNNMPLPVKSLNFDFNNNSYLIAYHLLLSALGISNKDHGLLINRANYIKGNTLFAFDVNPTEGLEGSLHLEKSGSVRIELKFEKALTEAVNCIVYSEHQALIEIDKYRRSVVL